MPISDDQLEARSKASQALVAALVQAFQGQGSPDGAAHNENPLTGAQRSGATQGRVV